MKLDDKTYRILDAYSIVLGAMLDCEDIFGREVFDITLATCALCSKNVEGDFNNLFYDYLADRNEKMREQARKENEKREELVNSIIDSMTMKPLLDTLDEVL